MGDTAEGCRSRRTRNDHRQGSPWLLRRAIAVVLVVASWRTLFHSSLSSSCFVETIRPLGRRQPSVARFAVANAPGKYKALTRIRVREEPDIKSSPTGQTVEPGEEFEVIEVQQGKSGDELTYVKVSDRGWVFDQGIAGDWVGKPIIEAVAEPAPAPADAPSPSPAKAADAPSPAPTKAVETILALGTAPLRTIRMPMGALGAGIDYIQLEIDGKPRPLNFVIASSFPINAVTPKGQEAISGTPAPSYKGGWLSAAAAPVTKVDLKNIEMVESGAILDDIYGCEVMDTMQAQLADQIGIEVHGMLGKPFFEKYDVDIDRYSSRLELYQPGQVASLGFYSSVKHMPALELPAGMVGVSVTGNVAMQGTDLDTTSGAFVGVIDTGSPYSIINWEAAKLMGFSGESDPRLQGVTKMLGAGRDGKPVEMPVIRVRLTVSGIPQGVKPMLKSVTKDEFEESGGKGWYLESESLGKDASEGITFGAVNVAVGDTLPFASMDDSTVGPFTGAAAILGQDLLFQTRRVVMNMNDKNFWMEAGDIRDNAEM